MNVTKLQHLMCLHIADIDECDNTTTNNCSQVCTNIDGGFVCSCHPGYMYDASANTCVGMLTFTHELSHIFCHLFMHDTKRLLLSAYLSVWFTQYDNMLCIISAYY